MKTTDVVIKNETIKLSSYQLEIIKEWDQNTLVNNFIKLTKISEKTQTCFKKLSFEEQKDALLLFISKQPLTKMGLVLQIIKPMLGTIRRYKDGDYEYTTDKTGKNTWKKIVLKKYKPLVNKGK